ncbi:LAFE_0G06128g1_1 [Lachancea fermentati]|uniref:LAFE_0G06128g1_1 n=1 Tax=Lachancea fermentati TaxID=4955 RepID=A0A1G4MH73_LACFM|nr:LAFE_0G06128g1_1 [Lachancea fermentati]
MAKLKNLPTEIKIALLELCPVLAFVNREFYQLNNFVYRDRCLSIRPLPYWEKMRLPISEYMKSLDRVRKASRLLNARHGSSEESDVIEYLSDSWQIVFHVFFANPKFFDLKWIALNLRPRSLEGEITPGFGGNIELLSNTAYQCNLWIRVKSTSARLRALRSIISTTDFEQEWRGLFIFLDKSLPLHIEDWSRTTGLYCINMGMVFTQIEEGDNLRQLKRLQAVVLGVEDNEECTTMDVVGFDFVPYQNTKKWVLFHTQDDDCAFNPYERTLSKMRMEGKGGLRTQFEKIPTPLPCYERPPKCQLVFKYPKDKQLDEEGIRDLAYPYLGQPDCCNPVKQNF